MQPSAIEIRLRNAQELRDLWLDELQTGGVFVEGNFILAAGVPIRLRVTIDSPAASTVLDGTVVWRRLQRAATGPLRAGIAIAFSSSARARIEYLARLAKGFVGEGRAAVRYSTDVRGDLVVHATDRTSPACLVDVGVRGARIVVNEPLSVCADNLVEMRVGSLRKGSTGLFGRVAWSNGDSVGVRLVLETVEERVQWAKIVTRARAFEHLSAMTARISQPVSRRVSSDGTLPSP